MCADVVSKYTTGTFKKRHHQPSDCHGQSMFLIPLLSDYETRRRQRQGQAGQTVQVACPADPRPHPGGAVSTRCLRNLVSSFRTWTLWTENIHMFIVSPHPNLRASGFLYSWDFVLLGFSLKSDEALTTQVWVGSMTLVRGKNSVAHQKNSQKTNSRQAVLWGPLELSRDRLQPPEHAK